MRERKKKNKTTAKLLGFVMMAAMVAGMVLSPLTKMTVNAATNYAIYIGTTQIDSTNKNDVLGDGTVKYNSTTNTLYLKNANLSTASSMTNSAVLFVGATMDGLKIRLTGTSTITAGATSQSAVYLAADVTFCGNGTLIMDGGTTSATDSHTLSIASTKNIVLTDDATLQIKGGKSTTNSNALEVSSAATVTVESGSLIAESITATPNNKGIHSQGTITVNGGMLKARALNGTTSNLPIDGTITTGTGVSLISGANTEGSVDWVVYGPPTTKAGEHEVEIDPSSQNYEDVDIDVFAFTEEPKVYSVDVEWGAMTFVYETAVWNTKTLTKDPGGWKVYDSVRQQSVDETQTQWNEIEVTNYSNDTVYATLVYSPQDGYEDINGQFSNNASDTDTAFTAAAGGVLDYLTLSSADNNLGAAGAGKETSGRAYFFPTGIMTPVQADTIPKWTTIGKITVAIERKQPQ
ncbi:MAG: hypothetical protein ACI4ES_16755 [Roseburia sp.]